MSKNSYSKLKVKFQDGFYGLVDLLVTPLFILFFFIFLILFIFIGFVIVLGILAFFNIGNIDAYKSIITPITAPVVTVLSALIGILTIYLTRFHERMEKEKERKISKYMEIMEKHKKELRENWEKNFSDNIIYKTAVKLISIPKNNTEEDESKEENENNKENEEKDKKKEYNSEEQLIEDNNKSKRKSKSRYVKVKFLKEEFLLKNELDTIDLDFKDLKYILSTTEPTSKNTNREIILQSRTFFKTLIINFISCEKQIYNIENLLKRYRKDLHLSVEYSLDTIELLNELYYTYLVHFFLSENVKLLYPFINRQMGKNTNDLFINFIKKISLIDNSLNKSEDKSDKTK